jgi:DNA-binding GntR family transcriptional regulator
MSQYPKPHLVLIKPQGLHKLVVEQIQQMIIEGALAPGTRLNERLLCEKLGVSRTPLREALKILAALGLVELLPNRGAAVVQLSAQDIAETFEMISHLESMAGELACARITDPEINEIRALHFEMLACHARRDLPAYYRTNQQIHDLINRAARNEVLREIYMTVNSRVKALRFSSNLDRDRWDAAVREHTTIVEALEARDGKRLAAILESHVLSKRDAAMTTVNVCKPEGTDG